MNNIQLICIDVDGTLYNGEKKIPEENITVLQEAHRRGITIAIATGRMYHYGKLYGETLGIPTKTIASNGAFVKDEEEVLLHEAMDEEDVTFTVRAIQSSGLYAHFNGWNTLIQQGDLGDGNGYVSANARLPEGEKVTFLATEDLEKTLLAEGGILKAIVFSKGDHAALAKLKRVFQNHPRLQTASSSKDNLEIFRKDVNKASGIEALAKKLGIDKAQIMAIGDEENDLPMIRYAGLGIAMGNATDAVKKAAHAITLTNDEAGVAYAVKKYVFQEAF